VNPGQIFRYFPSLNERQKEMFIRLKPLYAEWNNRINVISRKDMDNFYTHHVLHSLSIARVISFAPGTRILDVGTGGGFPGIPLAIMFPSAEFSLLDSIGKKIKVVGEVASELDLTNIIPLRKRAEEEKGKYDFVVARAITDFSKFLRLIRKNIRPGEDSPMRNGILYLKGGDLEKELKAIEEKVTIRNISDFFEEPFFETKKIVYLPV
jgi:16S rRNA (guanine527-N7)-methyltransferase